MHEFPLKGGVDATRFRPIPLFSLSEDGSHGLRDNALRSVHDGGLMPLAAPPVVQDVLRSPGQPLDASTRAFFEPRFGQDLSHVRVHTDAVAAESARDINAQAYAAGRNIVFAAERYTMGNLDGQRLIAHEIAHAIQQRGAAHGTLQIGGPDSSLEHEADESARAVTSDQQARVPLPASTAAPFSVQRQPITATRNSLPEYKVDVGNGDTPREVKTSRTVGTGELQLSFDRATGIFTITFPMVWIFVHRWTDAQRNSYVSDFEAVVTRVWNDRFPLKETQGKRRSAHVHIAFDEKIIYQQADEFDEARELSKNLDGRWLMDVRNLHVRANVQRTGGMRTVHLDEAANKPSHSTAKDLRAHTPLVSSDSGGNQTFTQTTSAHEFGHMIGLADEYVMDADTTAGVSAARMLINSRIMNVGERVTPDAYKPFAEWLSDLTSSTWRVGS